MKYSIQHIAEILNCEAQLAAPASPVEHLLTDSRRLAFADTTLFFALQTGKRDGHNFIEELYHRGVRNFAVRKNFDTGNFTSANFIFPENTLDALQQLAAYHRMQFHYPVIGITGSNGKTIVKEWLYQLLSSSYNIVRSPRSYNSQVGVPLSLWLMNEEHTLAVIEAGISKPQEMEKLQKMIQPSIGVFTNIGEAHSENFSSLLQKAKEKCLLFKQAQWVVYPADSAIIHEAVSEILPQIKKVTWGRNEHATVQVTGIVKKDEQSVIAVRFDNKTYEFKIPFSDDASEQNALTCITILLHLNIPAENIQQKLLQLHAVEMRLQLMEAVNQCSVINDSYSFDITSFSAALDFLLQQHHYAGNTVIISDLPETNEYKAYGQVADMMAAKNIQRVITVGEQWMHYASLLGKFSSVQQFTGTEEFLRQFSSNHFRNEIILLKGARRFAFEKISDRLEKKVHQTVMEINLTALVNNLNEYRSILRSGVKIMAMVKAFGYGSGSAEIASLLQFHKADYLGVAYADEGAELRNAGISLPIMVMNVDDAAFESLIQYNLEPELYSFEIFNSFTRFLERQGLQEYPVHIKLDTGMHRLGFEEKDMSALCELLRNNKTLAVESVFSHLAASEDAAHDNFTLHQAAVFENCCRQLQQVIPYPFLKHIANTAAIARMPPLQYDMVRLGIGLYGVNSTKDNSLALQNVITLKTTVAQIKKVKAGDAVGYGRKGLMQRDSVIATIRIGYADGFDRRLGNGIGKVFINEMRAPVAGVIAMDMAMIDITDVPGVQVGDEVEIFGSNISVSEIAAWCNTIPYEILTGINLRVKRIYTEE